MPPLTQVTLLHPHPHPHKINVVTENKFSLFPIVRTKTHIVRACFKEKAKNSCYKNRASQLLVMIHWFDIRSVVELL